MSLKLTHLYFLLISFSENSHFGFRFDSEWRIRPREVNSNAHKRIFGCDNIMRFNIGETLFYVHRADQ